MAADMPPAKSLFAWLSGICGGNRRQKRLQQTGRDNACPPFQPKTARFYGVQPLFPGPSPVSRPIPSLSECGLDTAEQDRGTSREPSSELLRELDDAVVISASRAQLTAGEKLERWLGENLRTIPEDERFELEGDAVRPRSFLWNASNPPAASAGPSTAGEEFELIVQGTSALSVSGGEELVGSSVSIYSRPPTSYTAASFLENDLYANSQGAIANFLAAMRGRQSLDGSSITTELTEGASWVFKPLHPAPRHNQPRQSFPTFRSFYDFQSSSGSPGRSLSTNSRTAISETSTELALSSCGNSVAEERRTIRRRRSSSTFRFVGRWEERKLRQAGTGAANQAEDLIPDPPIPAAQIPWRMVSVRAVRRRLEHQSSDNNFNNMNESITPLARGPKCLCLQRNPSGSAGQGLESYDATEVSRVQNWISVQQQYLSPPATHVRPHESTGLHLPITSIYPIRESHTEGSGGPRSLTFGDVGERDEAESLVSITPMRARGYRQHDENCPCYNDIPAPVYQEVDPNPVS
ncbi:hypothetical protein BDZ91DRAFT_369667 [Kalaharituber pfeilii]|nr:hypothetical protein BDZ91DRAFT_369667 [Kalaharituber pfeilii]